MAAWDDASQWLGVGATLVLASLTLALVTRLAVNAS
jgi:hypothetical protein